MKRKIMPTNQPTPEELILRRQIYDLQRRIKRMRSTLEFIERLGRVAYMDVGKALLDDDTDAAVNPFLN